MVQNKKDFGFFSSEDHTATRTTFLYNSGRINFLLLFFFFLILRLCLEGRLMDLNNLFCWIWGCNLYLLYLWLSLSSLNRALLYYDHMLLLLLLLILILLWLRLQLLLLLLPLLLQLVLWFLLVYLSIRGWRLFREVFFFSFHAFFRLRFLGLHLFDLMRSLPLRRYISLESNIFLFFLSVEFFFIWVISTKGCIASKSRQSLNDFLFLEGVCYFIWKQSF